MSEKYPITFYPSGYKRTRMTNVSKTQMTSGSRLRINRLADGKDVFMIELEYAIITNANMSTLRSFHREHNGPETTFDFRDIVSDTWTDTSATAGQLSVGTGNGSAKDFDLPADGVSGETIYVNGVVQTGGGVDYTLSAGGGTNGRDQITFEAGSTPANGHAIEADLTGYRYFTAHFEDDNLEESKHSAGTFSVSGVVIWGE